MKLGSFDEERDWAKTRYLNNEEEYAKTILLVAPLLFIFFENLNEIILLDRIILVSLVITSGLAALQLLICKLLIGEYWNHANDANNYEATMDEIHTNNPTLSIEQIDSLAKPSSLKSNNIIRYRKILDYLYLTSAGCFITCLGLLAYRIIM